MSRLAMALAFVAASGADATASCHHYSHWYYPWKQSCGASVMRARAAEDRAWYVEIVLPDDREAGIEKLKEMLK